LKLVLGLLGCLAITVMALPLLVGAVIATHPWLAIGTLSGPIQVRPSAVKAGVPADAWPLMVSAANQSTCHVSAEDLAAIAAIERDFGQPADRLAAITRALCERGYSVDRVRALNSFGGCDSPKCVSGSDFASAVSSKAASFRVPIDVVQTAERWLGVPYVFGGCSTRGVDCSCLVQLVFRSLAISLPRTAAEQFAATARVAREGLQPGDLVFFANTYMPGISHVGIYIGGGQQINAPTEGQRVTVQPVFDGYWGAHFVAGGRVIR
jgi:cell wall-associated NlpC family hydrolase